jgi:hypothetical protein
MPDPNLPPLITFSTPCTPQPYQERFLAALEDGSRLAESIEAIVTAAAAFVPIGQAARRAQEAMALCARRALDAERGPTIGRKRRARRDRGRRRGNA